MARADDELPEIEVIAGDDVDGEDRPEDTRADGEVGSAPSRSLTPWIVGAVVAVVLVSAVGRTVRNDPPPPDDVAQPGATTTSTGSAGPDRPPGTSFSPPVRGEWRPLPTTLPAHTAQAPFLASVDDDRVLILNTDNSGRDVAGEILDLRRGTVEPIAASPLRWRGFPMVGWTGRELVVTGGSSAVGADIAGAAYDPATNSWRQIADPPGFEPGRIDNQAMGPGVWTREELISWQSELAYNPEADSWRQIAPSPLAPRTDEAAIATSGGVLVWGGCDPTTSDLATCHRDGALYDPVTDAWTSVPEGPLDGGSGALAVATTWHDRVVIVVPSPRRADAPTVAALDPSTLAWHELVGLPAEAWMGAQSVVWNGTHLVAWNVYTRAGSTRAGFVLNPELHRSRYPALDQWRSIPTGGVERQVRAALWTPHGILVAGGGSPALFTPRGEPCPGQYDPRDRPDPSAAALPELGTTTYDNVAATVLLNAQDIADRYAGVVDITVGPGWGVAYEDIHGVIEIHRDLEDHSITVHVVNARACGYTGPAFYPGPDERSVPIRFVYEST